jgi:hypothetical protein
VNPHLQKRRLADVVNEYGMSTKLEFDVDGKAPFIRSNAKFTQLLENLYSINVALTTENGISKVMHLPPIHRLVDQSLKSELTTALSIGTHNITFQNANQPKILRIDCFDLRDLWNHSESKKVCT